jgi:hypothetical protein
MILNFKLSAFANKHFEAPFTLMLSLLPSFYFVFRFNYLGEGNWIQSGGSSFTMECRRFLLHVLKETTREILRV